MKNNALRVCAICMAAFLLLGALFYFVAGESLHSTGGTTTAVSPSGAMGELLAEDQVKQAFVCEFDTLEMIALKIGTMARENTDVLSVAISDTDGKVLFEEKIDTMQLADNEPERYGTDHIPDTNNNRINYDLFNIHHKNHLK